LLTPRSSTQGASPATRDLSPGDNAQDEPHLATIAKRFSALALPGYSPGCTSIEFVSASGAIL
jgi:hypothetical protein